MKSSDTIKREQPKQVVFSERTLQTSSECACAIAKALHSAEVTLVTACRHADDLNRSIAVRAMCGGGLTIGHASALWSVARSSPAHWLDFVTGTYTAEEIETKVRANIPHPQPELGER